MKPWTGYAKRVLVGRLIGRPLSIPGLAPAYRRLVPKHLGIDLLDVQHFRLATTAHHEEGANSHHKHRDNRDQNGWLNFLFHAYRVASKLLPQNTKLMP